MKWVVDRFKEPSTWAGLAAVLVVGPEAAQVSEAVQSGLAEPQSLTQAALALLFAVIAVIKRSPNAVK